MSDLESKLPSERPSASLPFYAQRENTENIQFVIYFKLSSRKSLARSEKRKKRMDDLRLKHDELRAALEENGLIVKDLWMSENGVKYHWGITASEERLRQHAELTHYEIRLRPQYGGGTAPFFASYAHLFQEVDGSLFSELDRQRLVFSLMTSRAERDGAELDLTLLYRNGIIYKFFPLHKLADQKWLWDHWAKKPFSAQPIDQIRDYFGEKVGFYFGFLGYSIKWMLPISVIGLAVFIVQQIRSPALLKWNYIGSVFWSILMPIWATLFVEFWKRKSEARAVRWGMDTLDLAEPSRPSYSGNLKIGTWWGRVWIDLETAAEKDPNLKRFNVYENPSKRLRRAILGSWPILFLMTLVSLGIAWIFILLGAMVSSLGGRVAVSAANGVVIVILSIIYRVIARYLTERENHRTDTDLENSLIMKIFIFDFVNAFGTVFYQAFIKYNIKWTSLAWLSNGACMAYTGVIKFECALAELSTMLITVFIVRICFFQMLDFLVPLFYTLIGTRATKLRQRLTKSGKIMEDSQVQSKMAPFAGTLDEYSGMIMQFGYVTLLAAACPLGPIIALLSYMIETRTDAYKMLYLNQRAPAVRAKHIGTYQGILHFMAFISIVSNAALVALSDGPSASDLAWRLSLIIIGENLIIATKFIIGKIVASRPESVEKTLAKRSFIREELMGQENPRIVELGFRGVDDTDSSPKASLGSFQMLRKKLKERISSVRSINSWRTDARKNVQVGDYISPYDRHILSDSDEEDVDLDPHPANTMDSTPLLESRNGSKKYNGYSDNV